MVGVHQSYLSFPDVSAPDRSDWRTCFEEAIDLLQDSVMNERIQLIICVCVVCHIFQFSFYCNFNCSD
jgi:hypothetical protein